MLLTESPTELTTGATDAVLALECVMLMLGLRRAASAGQWRAALWCWVFGLMAFSSLLGTIVHGLMLTEPVRAVLWRVLYLGLGVLVALFMVGAVHDWRGRAAAARLVPWSIGVVIAFFWLTEFLHGVFAVFVIYAVLAMLGALVIYLFLAATRRLNGAGIVAAAILLNMVAMAVQASDVSVHILLPFDHNGIFHLVQMAATALLGLGLGRGMQGDTPVGVRTAERTQAGRLPRMW